ncbi:MAG: DUF3467 domain-containing protein [Terriglobia bacterium]
MEEKREFLTTQALTPDQVKEITEISEDFFTVFSNQVRVAASPVEFRLFFGENYPTASGKMRIIEHLSVILTPMQAKLLASNLVGVIQRIESDHGPIPVPQESQPAPPTAVAAAAQSAPPENE